MIVKIDIFEHSRKVLESSRLFNPATLFPVLKVIQCLILICGVLKLKEKDLNKT